MLSTFEIFATHTNVRAAHGVIFDDGAVAARLTVGDKYRDGGIALTFPSMGKLQEMVGIFGDKLQLKIDGVVVTQSKLTDAPRTTYPAVYNLTPQAA